MELHERKERKRLRLKSKVGGQKRAERKKGKKIFRIVQQNKVQVEERKE